MSNQLEKLKNNINKEYVDKFELNLMKSSGFIPVDKRHGSKVNYKELESELKYNKIL